MKFPSINQLSQGFLDVCKRFPLSLLFVFLGTCSALLLVENQLSNFLFQNYSKAIYLAIIGLNFSLAAKLFFETKKFSKAILLGLYALIILFIAFLFYFLNPFLYETDIYKIAVLLFLAHLLVSISAFSKKEESNGFWQLNKLFFLRICTSALYSAILFIGLSVALLAIDTLFVVKIHTEVYLRLWVIIVGVFNTIFFLAGIKIDINSLNEEAEYPKSLKVFTQYVLIPLSTIYLFILLAYEAKIVLEWILPSGYVSTLILCFAVFGILSLLLVYPIRNFEENKWINWFAKWFYILMIPLIFLLFLAIYKRLTTYGITEQRYLLLILGVWLLFIVVYFLIKGTQNIRIIPFSLAIVSVFVLIGPWGMSSVSKESQIKRLKLAFKKKVENSDAYQVQNIISYLTDNHGITSLQSFTDKNLQKIENDILLKDTLSNFSFKYALKDSAIVSLQDHFKNGKNINNIVAQSRFEPVVFNNNENYVLSVFKTSKIIFIDNSMNYSDKAREALFGGVLFKSSVNNNKDVIVEFEKQKIVFSANKIFRELLISKYPKEENGYNSYSVPSKEMFLQTQKDNWLIKVVFNSITGNKFTEENEQIQNIEAFVIISKE